MSGNDWSAAINSDTPLAPNTRLGRYEIRSKLGAGRMGKVYLAEDTGLGRKVALKLTRNSQIKILDFGLVKLIEKQRDLFSSRFSTLT